MKKSPRETPSPSEPGGLGALPDWFTQREVIPLDDQLALVVSHETMRDIVAVCRSIAESPGPVLLTGETGVGKSLLSRFIHASRDPYAPFVSATTTGLDARVLTGLIFGEGDGAKGVQGLAAEAAGGTLVLEEMGDLPRAMQRRLMETWDREAAREASPAGPAQWICTTNLPRKALLAPGHLEPGFLERFRQVHVPPLRERKQDIPAMVAYFSRLKASKEASLASLAALAKRLSRHSFPGNVRELESIVSLEASGLPWEWRIAETSKDFRLGKPR